MDLDAFDLFGRCHRIYVQAMRQVIRERLEEHYGKDWWINGVLATFWDDWPKQLDDEAKQRGLPDYQEILDTRHFGYILTRQNHSLFQREFPDSLRAFKRFQQITAVRNNWAHVQNVSTGHLYRAASTIQDILADLKCTEALEVERLRRESMSDTTNGITEEPIEDVALESESMISSPALTEPIDNWRRLSSYLRVDQEITYQDTPEGRMAQVTVTLRNIAPAIESGPQVIFRDVSLKDIGANRSSSRAASQANWEIGRELEPGDSRETKINIPWERLAQFDLHVCGRIDGEALLNFRNSVELEQSAAKDLRERFAEFANEVDIEGLVTEVMGTYSAIDDNTSMKQIREARESVRDYSRRIGRATGQFRSLGNDYGLHHQSPIFIRVEELREALQRFDSAVQHIGEALDKTDPVKLAEVQASLKDAQLAVLRVESELRSVGGG